MTEPLLRVAAITLFVEDRERSKAFYEKAFDVPMVYGVCAELAARGVDLLNGPMNRAWGMRTASFSDPDGHVWEIAQNLANR